MKKTSIAALLLLVLPAASLAAVHEAFGENEELAKLRAEIAAAKLDRLLDLSRDQALALLPVVKEGVQLREQMKAERAKHEPALAKALTAIRDDVRATGAASEASIKALKEARAGFQVKDLHGKVVALREKARDLLSADQRERVKTFDPRPLGGREGPEMGMGFGGQAEGEPPHGKGHGMRLGGPMKMHRVAMIALSPEFQSLLQARASK